MAKDLHRFYMPNLGMDPVQTLDGDEAAHAGRVLRLTAKDEVILCDGKGRGVRARILVMSKKSFEFEIQEELTSEMTPPSFHLVIAPTKNMDRLEWCMEKCTEIGLSRITPILCQNSERRKIRTDRLQKIGVSAMKQSKSLYAPLVDEPISIKEFLEGFKSDDLLLIAHCREGEKKGVQGVELPATMLIGPEGDFTKQELELAFSIGAQPVHLGDKRLRTETAAVVACALMNL